MKVEPATPDPATNPDTLIKSDNTRARRFWPTPLQPLSKDQLSFLATWSFRFIGLFLAVFLLAQPGQKWLSAFVFGCGFATVGFGVYLTFRVLNFPDLTIEGSYALGATVSAALITGQKDNILGNPWIATLIATLCGALAGATTGFLHTRLKINGLLASILVTTGLYSINIRVLGKSAYIALVGEPTVVDSPINLAKTVFGIQKLDSAAKEWLRFGFFAVVALLMLLALNWFMNTQLGLALRATGDNEAMIKALGFNTNFGKVLVLTISNGFFGLAGALVVAQYLNSVSSDAGLGLIVIGLAAVIVGESFLPPRSVLFALLGAWIGSIIYRVIFTSVFGLDLTWDIFVGALLTLGISALVSYFAFLTLKSSKPALTSLLSLFLGAIVAAPLSALLHFLLSFSLGLDLSGSIIKVEAGDIKLALAILIVFALGIPALRSRLGATKFLKAAVGKQA